MKCYIEKCEKLSLLNPPFLTHDTSSEPRFFGRGGGAALEKKKSNKGRGFGGGASPPQPHPTPTLEKF